ncbi:MAG: response regulator [Gammaproteobacteria bacterium]|nr:response regulator [Gammaproteobacteria bacterium]MBT4607691.1 response regulator [Thiotrichales bacterium]MBT3471447.1 response regulator [Gammaproteobacteria bacterium]MBT3967218.1 response regulator [Gammaproteobacteria bacterium]MBT4080181.1 response regulator [Gammaproteobacteria bacterium]
MESSDMESSATILLVDDHPGNLKYLTEILEQKGYSIRVAIDGEDALESLRTSPVDLVLLDILLPGIDGFEVCKEIKADPQIHNIPVLFISALDHPKDKVKGFEVGGVDYVSKPFEEREVMARIQTHIKLYRAQQVLAEAKDIAEAATASALQANRAKDEFLASMSHELRTPLTSVIGNAELMIDSGSCGACAMSDASEILNAIHVAGKTQLALVNDILDLSKIEAGKFHIDDAPFNLAVLLKEVEQIFSIRSRDSGLSFQVENNAGLKQQVWGDSKRVGQVLINLLGNSVKFTEEGGVKLSVWHDEAYLRFSVVDTGIGMSQEVLGRLFKPFEQADRSITRRFGGTGLGLHISWSLAEMMNGTIEVSSQEGVGSTFELKIPYRPSEISVNQDAESVTDPALINQKLTGHVLVAEDIYELQLLECRILEAMGLTVTTANNGKEAVELATDHNFELILMDMQMPVMGGLEATKALREAGNQTPIIALTANVMQEHRNQFHEVGCDGFLGKPIDKQELRSVLGRYLVQQQEQVEY